MKKIIITLIIVFFSMQNLKAVTNISINNNKIIPEFNKNTHVYNVYVNSKTEIITITTTNEENETVTGTGSISLKKGLNIIEIKSYINGIETNTYKLNIVRGEMNFNENDATLKNLTINNYEIDFKSDIFYYEIEAKEENNLNIDYETENPSTIVKMTGNTTLTKETNIIKLKVTSENKKHQNTYTIKINKTITKEEQEEKKESIFDTKTFTELELNLIRFGFITIGIIIILILFYIIFIKKRKPIYKRRLKLTKPTILKHKKTK